MSYEFSTPDPFKSTSYHQENNVASLKKTVVATMDLEGFYHGNNFYPRELAVKSTTFHSVFSFRTPLDARYITPMDMKRISSQEQFSHGLRLHPFVPDGGMDSFLVTINTLQRILPTGFIGIKNFELQKILTKLNIPFIVLQNFHQQREVDFSTCTVHSSEMSPKAAVFRCAFLHCSQMWNYIHGPEEGSLVELDGEKLEELDMTTIERELMAFL